LINNAFIEKKLKALQDIEAKIDSQISINYNMDIRQKEQDKGIEANLELVLQKSNWENLEEIEWLVLREQKIKRFESTKDMDFDNMMNLEWLWLSHNLLKDISGLRSLPTIVELNLNFNLISDILALEEMTNLEKLFWAHNKIADITPLAKLKKITTLDLTDNDIFHEESTLATLVSLPNLKELSIGKNSVYSKEGFKHHLVLKLTLSELEYEKITDLDKDIAKMYYEDNGLEIPQLKKKIVKTGMFVFFLIKFFTF